VPTTYRIKLTPSSPEIVKFKGRDTFRLQVVASDGENLPNEIFGHQRTLIDANTSTTADEFCFICSPYDLSIYPANAPAAEQSPAFFRKDTIDILLPGVEKYEEVWGSIQTQVCALITLLESLDDLNTGTAVWCPD